jgi:hypothetical protein
MTEIREPLPHQRQRAGALASAQKNAVLPRDFTARCYPTIRVCQGVVLNERLVGRLLAGVPDEALRSFVRMREPDNSGAG